MKRWSIGLICLVGWLILVSLIPAPGVAAVHTGRDDGLTIIKLELPEDNKTVLYYLTLVLKTGYAHDPAGKAGLTRLTNQLLYQMFSNSSAMDVRYDTYASFSRFNFLIAAKDFKSFCGELDAIIRMEALLLYDECRDIIRDYQNRPRLPGAVGQTDLYKLLFGDDHPCLAVFNGNITQLDINTVNDWFRKIYRPNNMIIAASTALPADFLMKPSGRELKEPVIFPKIPPAGCAPWPAIHQTQIEGKINSIFIGLPGPAVGDDGLFAMVILRRYLQKELWNKLREEMGLCYDLQVNYPYLGESAAPSFTISLDTLPADTDTAIAAIIEILKRTATKDGITAKQLALIKEQEKSRIERQKNSTLYKLEGLVYEKLFGAAWLKDSNEYLNHFNKVTGHDLAKLAADRLKYLKIVVAGPGPEAGFKKTNEVLKAINRLYDSLE